MVTNDDVGWFTVGVVGDSALRRFDSLVSLLNWHVAVEPEARIRDVGFYDGAHLGETCSQQFSTPYARGSVESASGMATFMCQGNGSIQLLLRALRWYYYARHASGDGVLLSINTGTPTARDFGSLDEFDQWLDGEGQGVEVLDLTCFKASGIRGGVCLANLFAERHPDLTCTV